jgi:predicted XRE-type DNA-binding protein
MPSKNKPPVSVLAFPKNNVQDDNRAAAIQTALEAAQKAGNAAGHDSVPDLCQDARRSLLEIRTMIENLLRDVMSKLDVDTWTLVHLLDERPSGVIDLMNGELDDFETETLIEYLEKLGSK